MTPTNEQKKEKQIVFSHRYPKLGRAKKALLLQVIPINLKDLTPPMRQYDTYIGEGLYYELPKTGSYMVLLFLGDDDTLFTTLRSTWPAQKKEFYASMIGEWFTIQINPSK